MQLSIEGGPIVWKQNDLRLTFEGILSRWAAAGIEIADFNAIYLTLIPPDGDEGDLEEYALEAVPGDSTSLMLDGTAGVFPATGIYTAEIYCDDGNADPELRTGQFPLEVIK
ncbi:MAG: hypothetical protein JNJ77_20090 [Planctomycetia bacterium]|nr:hypothetical protein [Planctomycetia bacterium]